MSYDSRMREIMEADSKRRLAREIEELTQLDKIRKGEIADSYHASRGITGEPSEKNRNYRVCESSWTRSEKKNGLAWTGPNSAPKVNTVTITKDGKTYVRPTRGFGRETVATKSARHNRRHITHKQDFARQLREKIGPAA